MHVPSRVQDIIYEYNEVKFIDALTFHFIQAEWFGSLGALQAVRWSEKKIMNAYTQLSVLFFSASNPWMTMKMNWLSCGVAGPCLI